MTLRRRLFLGGAAVLALLSLAGFGAARSDAPPTPARTLEGVAVTASGKPLAHATLYLFALPPGLTDNITLGDQSTVVTDGRGHFTWAVPESLPPLSDYVGVRPIDCYALAADRGTARFRLALRSSQHGTDAEGAARDLMRWVTRPCETKWLLGGPHPVLSVVTPDVSDVTLTVRGPDGLPLAGAEVQVVPADAPAFYGGGVLYTERTDAGGRLRLRCFSGAMRFQVFAPGVGFGSTGTFDAQRGQSAAPGLPPLAPFAHLSGAVAPSLIGPGASVHLEDFFRENDWYDPRAAVDGGGRWTLDGVLPGQHRLMLTGGRGESEAVWVTVTPGERVGGLALIPKEPPAAAMPAASSDKISILGRVTDAEGQPVTGVDVYAVCSFPGGWRRRQEVFKAATDGGGNYVIPVSADPGPQGPTAHVVAHLAGFGLAAGDGGSEKGPVSGAWKDIRVDLVLPATHSGLTVRVLRDGKPLPDVPVELTAQEGSRLIPVMYRESDRGEAAQALRVLLAPSVRTGPDGTAHFADLKPGLWDLTANQPVRPWLMTPRPTTPFNVSLSVAVRAGQELSYAVSVSPPPVPVVFRALSPVGLPPTDSKVLLSPRTAASADNFNFSPLDAHGNGQEDFYSPGLWLLTTRFRDTAGQSNALPEPFYQGSALVAFSAATPTSGMLVLHTRRVGQASLRVRLEDERKRPIRGTVSIGDVFNDARYAASADASGLIVFPNMPSGSYTLTARLAGRPERMALNHDGSPFPSDAVLVAGTSQPLPQTVVVRGGEEAIVTFRPQHLGYLRLRLNTPPQYAKNYYFDARLPSERDFIDARLDTRTGEYVVGPLPAGHRTFHLFRQVLEPISENLPAGDTTVTVEAGRVVRATLVAREPPGPPLLLNSLTLTGTVLMPDGKTPAWGARVGLFTADRPMPMPIARADTTGRLTLKDFWLESRRPEQSDVGSPTGPVLAAWLPGANGATVIPYVPGQDARLVLPPALSLHGRVTVGGQPVLGLPPSLYRVRAECHGHGSLNDALSVEATAQADGTFELAGLTPGTYKVQAARDDVWLSETQTLAVGAGPSPDLSLDIGPPGLPVVLHLEDGKGRALPGREVRIARPDGPLTGQIWPATLTSDASGDLRVDGLEAGPHRLTVAGQTVPFDVPAWTVDTAPETRRVVVRHTAP